MCGLLRECFKIQLEKHPNIGVPLGQNFIASSNLPSIREHRSALPRYTPSKIPDSFAKTTFLVFIFFKKKKRGQNFFIFFSRQNCFVANIEGSPFQNFSGEISSQQIVRAFLVEIRRCFWWFLVSVHRSDPEKRTHCAPSHQDFPL